VQIAWEREDDSFIRVDPVDLHQSGRHVTHCMSHVSHTSRKGNKMWTQSTCIGQGHIRRKENDMYARLA
jgi:hypothetical protein